MSGNPPGIEDGIYTFSVGALFTAILDEEQEAEDARVVCVVKGAQNSGEEMKWEIKNLTNGNVSIQNVAHKTHLSFAGDPTTGEPCIGSKDIKEWKLELAGNKSRYLIITPEGSDERVTMAFSLGLAPLYPMHTRLAPATSPLRTVWTVKLVAGDGSGDKPGDGPSESGKKPSGQTS